MQDTISKLQNTQDHQIKIFLILFALIFIGSAFLLDSVSTIIDGMSTIIMEGDRLITDYVEIAGFGATFLNAGLLMLLSLGLLQLSKAKLSGMAIAAVFLMGGFGMFGKNIVNIWGIITGVYIFAKLQKHPFRQYIYIAFFGTSLAPLTSELALWHNNTIMALLVAFLVTVAVGFFLAPVSNACLAVHQGYNLYNVGFGAGLAGTIIYAIISQIGYESTPVLHWYDSHHLGVILLLYGVFICFIICAFILDKQVLSKYRQLMKRSGRLVSDFIRSDNCGPVLFNMGILGITYTSYVLLVGGHINGPTIGGILTIVGFGGFGKHLRNTIPLVLGVVIAGYVGMGHLDEPVILLAALFATGLAPIAGQFGWIAGIVTGMLHLALVQSIGAYHGGINLYNNGFSAGLVALFVLPIIDVFAKQRRRQQEARFSKRVENDTLEEEIIRR
ncbi:MULTISPECIES: DUF1576 domain-containing protein [unclassified Breznakia]|uniref:DUF1576 domain-containing protein n=1 Tax=unclassified Breznakia TaxID=2623764 RepID=UPI0024739B4B|nr:MULTISPECIES: DUF1576 domain-containing protein [unclassified Breznakia]MDH6366263.1 hypothetical protein [Breznakia sp. PH1-1]MDH6403356.1 hypothetical protein [Breznakia sp. PF1-11]MDH6411065.1 hypothetical protein [Breznakia sp. PFB1-11]MDH6413429.1 hypothetical protein [Breznakia sp. PFB1-14]MDH6416782.1 hypothetical protein [Breznakia sp. PFB1-4]